MEKLEQGASKMETSGPVGTEEIFSNQNSALEVLKIRDLVLLLANRYLDNLGDVMRLALVCRRTAEILRNHPEIVEARNDYRMFKPHDHTEVCTPRNCPPCSRGFGRAGRFEFTGQLCKDHGGECKYCHPPQLAGDGIWEGGTISAKQCHVLQRAANALYTVGNPRLALHYWQQAKLCSSSRPGVRISVLVRMRLIPAIQWFAERNGRSKYVVTCDQPETLFQSAVSRPIKSFMDWGRLDGAAHLWDDDAKWHPVLGACMDYLDRTGKTPVDPVHIGSMFGWMNAARTTRPEIIRDFLVVFPEFFATWPDRLEYCLIDMLLACHESHPMSVTRKHVAGLAYLLNHVQCRHTKVAFVKAIGRYVSTIIAKTLLGEVFPVRWACETLHDLFCKIAMSVGTETTASSIDKEEENLHSALLQSVFKSPGFLEANKEIVDALSVGKYADQDAPMREEFLKWLSGTQHDIPLLGCALVHAKRIENMGGVTHYIDFIFRHQTSGSGTEQEEEPVHKKIKNAAE